MYIRMSFGHVLLVGFCGKRRAEKVRDERRGEGGGGEKGNELSLV